MVSNELFWIELENVGGKKQPRFTARISEHIMMVLYKEVRL